MKSFVAASIASLALFCAGCGSDDDPSDQSSAAGAGAAGSGAAGVGGSSGPSGPGSGGSGPAGSGGGPTSDECFTDFDGPAPPDYDQYSPKYAQHCMGTNHQDITGVEKVVFLGDSITFGTPPTPNEETYRQVLGGTLAAKFPGAEIASCAENGARVDDLIPTQIPQCFPAPEQKKTLIIMTMGGNDVVPWAEDNLTVEEAKADAEKVAAEFQTAVEMLRDPTRFPNGSYVIFANVYEFTDGTGNVDTCPGASFMGLSGEYLEVAVGLARLDELYMKAAVDTGSDMVFLLEQFCGHGWHSDDPEAPCYLGPDTPRWFDFTCIHPNPDGHAHLAKMFQSTVDE